MTDEANQNYDRLAFLTTKIERESRFTRVVIVVCTIANLSVFIFAMLKVCEYVPPAVLAEFLGNMNQVVMTERAVENSNAHLNSKKAAGSPAATQSEN